MRSQVFFHVTKSIKVAHLSKAWESKNTFDFGAEREREYDDVLYTFSSYIYKASLKLYIYFGAHGAQPLKNV